MLGIDGSAGNTRPNDLVVASTYGKVTHTKAAGPKWKGGLAQRGGLDSWQTALNNIIILIRCV